MVRIRFPPAKSLRTIRSAMAYGVSTWVTPFREDVSHALQNRVTAPSRLAIDLNQARPFPNSVAVSILRMIRLVRPSGLRHCRYGSTAREGGCVDFY
jgi:hypothetical protein